MPAPKPRVFVRAKLQSIGLNILSVGEVLEKYGMDTSQGASSISEITDRMAARAQKSGIGQCRGGGTTILKDLRGETTTLKDTGTNGK